MWKGEWKAWVAWWVGWPLIGLAFLAVAVCVVTSNHHGPAWASRSLNEVRVLDAESNVVRVVTDRAELEAFAAWSHRADEVASDSSGRAWTHKLDIDAPGGGRWLYDAASGEFTVLSKDRSPVYRLKPADQARLSDMLAAGTPPTRPGCGDRAETRHNSLQDFRADEFKHVHHLADIPESVRNAVREALNGQPLAEPGGRWEPTDVIHDANLPRRRLIFAGYSRTKCLIYYEHGGRGRHEHVLLFSNIAGTAVSLKDEWRMLPQHVKSLSELADALERSAEGSVER